MAQKGRKSAEKKNSLRLLEEVQSQPRLEPPAELSPAEAGVWHKIVSTKPADWFDKDTEEILIAYCKHCVTAKIIDSQVSGVLQNANENWLSDPEFMKLYKDLIKMRGDETAKILALSRSMRLTQQAQYDTQKASRKNKSETGGKKPWQQ